jgi:hypothetical protein
MALFQSDFIEHQAAPGNKIEETRRRNHLSNSSVCGPAPRNQLSADRYGLWGECHLGQAILRRNWSF